MMRLRSQAAVIAVNCQDDYLLTVILATAMQDASPGHLQNKLRHSSKGQQIGHGEIARGPVPSRQRRLPARLLKI